MRKNNMSKEKTTEVTVKGLCEQLKRTIAVFTSDGRPLGKYHYGESIPELIAEMKTKRVIGKMKEIIAIVNCYVEASYQSEERCLMDGYEKIDTTDYFYKPASNYYSLATVVGY